MAYNEELHHQRRLDHYRNHLERQVNTQHRLFTTLLALANLTMAMLPSGNVSMSAAGLAVRTSGGAALWPVLSLIAQAVSLLLGTLSHRRELGDLNFREARGTWPEDGERRQYFVTSSIQACNGIAIALAVVGALVLLRR